MIMAERTTHTQPPRGSASSGGPAPPQFLRLRNQKPIGPPTVETGDILTAGKRTDQYIFFTIFSEYWVYYRNSTRPNLFPKFTTVVHPWPLMWSTQSHHRQSRRAVKKTSRRQTRFLCVCEHNADSLLQFLVHGQVAIIFLVSLC